MSNFCCIFLTSSSVPYWHFLKFLENFSIFFQRFTQNLDKLIFEVCPNFYSGLLNSFLPRFQLIIKFLFDIPIFVANVLFSEKRNPAWQSWKAKYSHFLKIRSKYPKFTFILTLIEKSVKFYMAFTPISIAHFVLAEKCAV